MPSTSEPSASSALETTQAGCLRAMGMLASGRAWLVFLIALALLLQIGLFAAANWADVLHKRDRPAAVDAEPAAPQDDPAAVDAPADEPAETAGNFLQTFWPAEKWQRVMAIALPIAGLAALVSVFALVVLTIVGVQVNLVGRLPALPAMLSAFYWSLITAVLVFPWGRLLGGSFAEQAPWVFCSYRDIDAAAAAILDPATQPALIWLRFLVWPGIALLAVLICGARFGHAFWQTVSMADLESKARIDRARD